jgi:hypothetical protein
MNTHNFGSSVLKGKSKQRPKSGCGFASPDLGIRQVEGQNFLLVALLAVDMPDLLASA